MSNFGLIMHKLKEPLKYEIVHIEICAPYKTPKSGDSGFILQDVSGFMFVYADDDYNITRYMGYKGTSIVGRGVLVEKIVNSEWVVAWRPFDAKPEAVAWEK